MLKMEKGIIIWVESFSGRVVHSNKRTMRKRWKYYAYRLEIL